MTQTQKKERSNPCTEPLQDVIIGNDYSSILPKNGGNENDKEN
jgi:hypothetical protein